MGQTTKAIDQRDLIDRILEGTGLDLAKLADLMGLSLRTLQKIKYRDVPLTDRNRRALIQIEANYSSPKRDTAGDPSGRPKRDDILEALENKKGLNQSPAIGSDRASSEVLLPRELRATMVSLLSWEEASKMTRYNEEEWTGKRVLAANIPPGVSFALTVRGDSMNPEIRENDIVVVSPEKMPRTGSVVLARKNDGDLLCKIYTPRNGGSKVVLSSYNKAHADIPLDRDELTWIFPVVSVIRNLDL